MHVTLAQWQHLTEAEKAKVTSIDASIVDDDPYPVGAPVADRNAWKQRNHHRNYGSSWNHPDPNPEYGE